MKNLALPHPKQVAVAVPANMRAGEPEDGRAPAGPDWGPVVVSYAGVPQIDPEWVACHRDDVHIVDVRSPEELRGELGPIAHAQLIPLDELRARTADVARDKPVVVVCQTGRRSALATAILRKAGLTRVANLAGGMASWRDMA
jgi:sulfur dioxygenase